MVMFLMGKAINYLSKPALFLMASRGAVELPLKSTTSDDFMVLFSTFTEYNMITLYSPN